MTTAPFNSGIVGLAGRLTEPTDRETYASLILYANSLPPGDEFRRLVELLGLASLLGQRIPDAVAELLHEFRSQAQAAAEYHAKVDERLASLPTEIAAGVDSAAVAKSMSEAFRQQLVTAGLHDTALLLKAATTTINTLSAEISTSLKPATQDYAAATSAITAETARLIAVAERIGAANESLRGEGRFWKVGFFVVLVVALGLFLKVL